MGIILMSDYISLLQKAIDQRKVLTIKTINGKPFLYSKGKYVSPASKEQVQFLSDKQQLILLQWTLKNLTRLLPAAKLLSELSKTENKS